MPSGGGTHIREDDVGSPAIVTAGPLDKLSRPNRATITRATIQVMIAYRNDAAPVEPTALGTNAARLIDV